MQYSKGTFCVVPVKYLKGLHPYAQVLYMWLCSHSNKGGECFPSISILSKETCLSKWSVIKYLEHLISKGFIKKLITKNGRAYRSNTYKLLILGGKNEVVAHGYNPIDDIGGGSSSQLLGSSSQLQGVVAVTDTNYTHINYTHGTISNNQSKKHDSDTLLLAKKNKKRNGSVGSMKSMSEILKKGDKK